MRPLFSVIVGMVILPSLLWALSQDREIAQYIHESRLDEDGLPVNSILDITQDPDGYLWLATEEGLVRFDGLRFVTYTEQEEPELPNRHIRTLLIDRAARLWIGTYNGVAYRQNGRFHRPSDPALRTSIWGMVEDREGTIWLATAGGLFAVRDTVVRYGADTGFPDNDMQFPHIDRDNNLWVVSGRRHLCKVKKDAAPQCTAYPSLLRTFFIDSRNRFFVGTYTELFLLTPTGPEKLLLPDGKPLVADILYEDRDGNLWAGSREQELVKISRRGKIYESDRRYDRVGPVRAFFEDRERNLWVGTGGSGLHRFSDSRVTIYGRKNGIDPEIILPVHRGRSTDLWFATYEGRLFRLNDGVVSPVPLDRELQQRVMIPTIVEDSEETLWVGTQGRGLWRIPKGGAPQQVELPVPGEVVVALYEDRDKDLWILIRGSGALRWNGAEFRHYTEEHGLPDNFVKVMRESPRGDFWIASASGGLAVRRGDRFVMSEEIFNEPLPTRAIQTIYVDREGLLWISTNGNGLFLWDGARLQPVRTVDGIVVSMAFSVVEDGSGNLWMGTNRGILRFERSEINLYLKGTLPAIAPIIFTTAHGLKSAECVGGTQKSADVGRDGKLYFATVGGLAAIDPENLPVNTVRPPVLIEQVLVDGMPDERAELSFQRGVDRLEIRYTALSFINPGYISFKYRLEGFDRDWIAAGTTRSAHYTNLEPGAYTFSVIAANSDGIWNDTGASIDFVVSPLFYQTRLFRFVAIVLVALLGYLLFLLRVRAVAEQNRRLSMIVEDKTRELVNANETLREMSLVDPLTGLRNRRFFSEITKVDAVSYLRNRARSAVGLDQRSEGNDKLWGLFLLDIDFFKQVNDRFGHDSGDAILTQFAALLKNSVRADDVVVRWGGEEFLIVLKNSVPEYLPVYAEKLRLLVQNSFLRTASGDLIRKTVSVGFVRLPFYLDDPERISLEQAVSVADLALYRAKREGRNRTIAIMPGDRIADTAPDAMQKLLGDLDLSVKEGFFKVIV